MGLLSSIKLNIAKKLQDPDYFYRYFRIRSQDEIAESIRNLREKRMFTQEELADLCGMKQSAISRLEKPSYAKWNFETLWRVAKPLKARWRLVLEPMEDVIEEYKERERHLNTRHAIHQMGATDINMLFYLGHEGGVTVPGNQPIADDQIFVQPVVGSSGKPACYSRI